MHIREARKKDCPRLLELVKELADFEKAPQEVTVTLQEFEDAGFGPKPVWKAFVAEVEGKIEGFALYYIIFAFRLGKVRGCTSKIFTLHNTCEGAVLGNACSKPLSKKQKKKDLMG